MMLSGLTPNGITGGMPFGVAGMNPLVLGGGNVGVFGSMAPCVPCSGPVPLKFKFGGRAPGAFFTIPPGGGGGGGCIRCAPSHQRRFATSISPSSRSITLL